MPLLSVRLLFIPIKPPYVISTNLSFFDYTVDIRQLITDLNFFLFCGKSYVLRVFKLLASGLTLHGW